MPSQGRLPGEKKPTKNMNNIEMKEHKVSPVLLNHKAGALVSLIETVTMLQICLCSTFWTQHKSYAKSRFSIIRADRKSVVWGNPGDLGGRLSVHQVQLGDLLQE